MRKHYLFIPLFVILILFQLSPSVPQVDLILNRLDSPITMPTFYYANLSGKKIRSYALTHNKFALTREKSVTYAEGFLPESTYTFYHNLLRDSLPTPLPAYGLYNFYEDAELAVLAYGTKLQDVYLVEKNTARVHSLVIPPTFDLGDMYLFHIQKVGDSLFFLAGKANSYEALLYKVYLPTFEVIDAIRLTTHPSVLNKFHAVLTQSGQAVFIHGNKLMIYNLLTDTSKFVPLEFVATQILAYKDQLIVLGQVNETSHYTLLDSTDIPLVSGTFTLPSPACTPVDLLVHENILYLATFDPNGTHYSNYLTLYDLNTSQMLYSLGIRAFKNYALLDMVLK